MNSVGENRFIYALKFIACLFVITIHARIPGGFGDFEMTVARFAVPFFFAVSGRFLLLDDGMTPITEVAGIRRKVWESLKKLLGVTAVVYLVHLLFSFTVHMLSGVTVSEYISSKFNGGELLNFLLFNSGKFIYDPSYVFDHMWYLFALIYVYVLIIIFAPVLRSWYRWLIALLLGVLYFGELLQTYYPIRPFDISISTWYVMRNWLFVGMPFVLLGVLFSDHVCDVRQRGEDYAKEYFGKLKVPALALIAAGIASGYAEYRLIDSKEVYFGSLLIVIGVLILSESLTYSGSILYILGKRASSKIYFYHVLVIALLDICSQKGVIPEYSMLQKPFLVMAICFVLFCAVPLYRERKTVKGRV